MEELIHGQLAQKELMESFIVNYKKAGQTRRTKHFYKKKLDTFQNYWDKFVEGHREILTAKYADKAFSNEKYDYFQSDVYSKVQDFFFSNYDAIEQRFLKEFPSKEPDETCDKSQLNLTMKENNEASIKLPKLSLEKFSGDYRKWPTFYDLFRTLVHENKKLAPVQKLQYLKLHLIGEPEQLLRHFQVTDKNYDAAWETLRERYENQRVLVNNELRVLFNQNVVLNESAQGVKGLLDTTSECLQALANLGVSIKGWDPIIVFTTVQKLPKETHQLWEQEVNKSKELPAWESLKEFLQSRFRTLEAVSAKKYSNDRDIKVKSSKTRISQSFYVAPKHSCPVCRGDHNIRKCPKFASLSGGKRLEIVKAHGLCINCLGSGHILKSCPSENKCYHCQQKHHSLLHRKPGESMNSNSNQNYMPNSMSSNDQGTQVRFNMATNDNLQPSTSLSTTNPAFVPYIEPSTSKVSSFVASQVPRAQILLATALVRVISPLGEEQIVRALIDQGSQASFLTESVAQHLKLKKESINASIQGLGQSEAGQANACVHFKIKPLTKEAEIEVSGLILRKLTHLLPLKTIIQGNWEHIKGLELADPKFYYPGRIDLLLGADVYCQIVMNGLVKGPQGTPIAQRTSLGWILSGEVDGSISESIKITNFHTYAELNNQLKKFWELEEVKSEKTYTEEEQKCEDIFKKTTKRLSSGRYEVELPLREPDEKFNLGKSRHIALSRWYQLERTLTKNPTLKVEYMKCLEEYASLGHMEKVKANEEDYRKEKGNIISYSCCYLPHHGVVKETSSTTKLRVVFDASKATQSGCSLNNMLLKGPTIQDELAEILIRWRKHRIALTADIEKMYRQIRVRNDHAELQRIVCRQSPETPVEDYKLLTVTFGTKSAPYLATRVLRQLAIDEKLTYPSASEVALSDFYVDDLLTGADSIKAALELQSGLIELMKTGGFALRKWSSNNSKLLENLPEGYKETKQQRDINGPENIRALGTHWNPQMDTFSFSINLGDLPAKWTKRSILSDVAKLFDPLGWLSPSIIIAKMMIQKLWLLGAKWDEEVTKDLETEWITYREKIKDCEDIRIKKWIRYSESELSLEIHGFSDASIKAYAAAVYIRSVHSNGSKYVNLIAAKTKVAPIKTVSLPRLELCAAVLLAKLICYVTKALKLSKPIPTFAWTDSEIVLAWLRAHPTKWTTFVANRVSYIHELLGENVWGHVASKDNPADCASRGMYPNDLRKHDLWWYGPQWLTKEKNCWPKTKELKSPDLEQRKIIVHHVNTDKDLLEAQFSSLTKLVRVTAYRRRHS